MTGEPSDHGSVCIGCGYDLRGSEGSDVCPECGKSIEVSRAAAADAAAEMDRTRKREWWPFVIAVIIGLVLGFLLLGVSFTAPSVQACLPCALVLMPIAAVPIWALARRRPESWVVLGASATAGPFAFALHAGMGLYGMTIVGAVALSSFGGAFIGRQMSDKIERTKTEYREPRTENPPRPTP
jgi:hypothetical protein